MRIQQLQMIDGYLDEGYTPYSSLSDFWSKCLFQHNNQLSIGEYIESIYLISKSERHIMTLKYYIYHGNEQDDYDKPFKINFQHCNGFVRSAEKLQNYSILTLPMKVYILLEFILEILFQKFSSFRGLLGLKYTACIKGFESIKCGYTVFVST